MSARPTSRSPTMRFASAPRRPPRATSRIGAIIDAARTSGAEAVHPGYGFLSENSEFAAACAAAGLVFVGPPPDAIDRMGSKVDARRLMERAGVPVVPGESPADQTDDALEAAAARVGFPVLVKPSGGGGGIGMRVVRRHEEAASAIQSARREAASAFGDGTLYVERLIERPRHIEIQIFADDHDHVISLVRARVLAAAAAPEDRRRESLAGGHARDPARDERRRRRSGARRRLPERRHH